MKTNHLPSRFRWVRFAVLAPVALATGCQGIFEDLARQPYEDAMRKGRILPGEYQRIRDQIELDARVQLPPPARSPTK